MELKEKYIKIINFYLYSSIHIALAASCFVLQVYILLDKKIDWNYIIYIFSGTLFLYILHNLLNASEKDTVVIREKTSIIKGFKRELQIILGISVILMFYTVLHLKFRVIKYLFFLGFVSIWYVVPIFGKHKRLRDFYFIKIFLIAFVWAALSYIPLLNMDVDLRTKLLIFAQNFLFIFALTLPFDIRDYDYEKSKGLKTLPIVLGKKGAIILAVILMILAFGISILLKDFYGSYHFAGLMIGYFITSIAIIYSIDKTRDYYFTGYLDGMSILVFLFVLFAGFLKILNIFL